MKLNDKIKYIGKCLLIDSWGKRILVIGDLHLGYDQSVRESGVFIGGNQLEEYKEYLTSVFDKTGKVNEIILMGDVKHYFAGILKEEWSDILGMLDFLILHCSKIIIVKGNHDNILEPIVKKRENVFLMDYYGVGELFFAHGDKEFDEMWSESVEIVVLGHGHPAIKLDDGVSFEKYKCFLSGRFRGKEIIIVPSFIEANEGSDPREYDLGFPWEFDFDEFKVIAVSDDLNDLEFGGLGELK